MVTRVTIVGSEKACVDVQHAPDTVLKRDWRSVTPGMVDTEFRAKTVARSVAVRCRSLAFGGEVRCSCCVALKSGSYCLLADVW